MISYGTMGEKDSFRSYCRASNMNIDDYNPISKDIEEYYEDDTWGPIINKAKELFEGTVVSASRHPCASLLLSSSITDETSQIRLKAGSGDDSYMVSLITSGESDSYKYLKNDF